MRPMKFFHSSISELEGLFKVEKTNPDLLRDLQAELQFRTVPRAVALASRVRTALSRLTPLAPVHAELFATPADTKQDILWNVTPSDQAPKTGEPVSPEISITEDEACSILRVPSRALWEDVERERAQIVQRSHPDALEGLTPEKRAAVVLDAKRANQAYAVLARSRIQKSA